MDLLYLGSLTEKIVTTYIKLPLGNYCLYFAMVKLGLGMENPLAEMAGLEMVVTNLASLHNLRDHPGVL